MRKNHVNGRPTIFSMISSGFSAVFFSMLFPLLLVTCLALGRAPLPAQSSVKPLISTTLVLDAPQSEVEIASSELNLEPSISGLILSCIASLSVIPPRVIAWSDETDPPSLSPVERYGRIFALPPPA